MENMAANSAAAMFLTGEGHDHRGRKLADVLALDDSALERSHDYIQWLFPLPEASRFNASAPVLRSEDIALIRSNDNAKANLLSARDRMLAFYSETTIGSCPSTIIICASHGSSAAWRSAWDKGKRTAFISGSWRWSKRLEGR